MLKISYKHLLSHVNNGPFTREDKERTLLVEKNEEGEYYVRFFVDYGNNGFCIEAWSYNLANIIKRVDSIPFGEWVYVDGIDIYVNEIGIEVSDNEFFDD